MTTKTKTEVVETKTKIQETTLTPLEEKVLRMRRGLPIPDDTALEFLGTGDPELSAQLAEIERRAIEAVGARNTAVKRQVLKSLRHKPH